MAIIVLVLTSYLKIISTIVLPVTINLAVRINFFIINNKIILNNAITCYKKILTTIPLFINANVVNTLVMYKY